MGQHPQGLAAQKHAHQIASSVRRRDDQVALMMLGFAINSSYNCSDFLVARDGIAAAVEAVTANPSTAEC